jgi:hypothetical protein
VLSLGDGLTEIGRLTTLFQQGSHDVEGGGHESLILGCRLNVDATLL